MSRRRRVKKREVLLDVKFSHPVVSKLINAVMLDGKKSVAEKITYRAMDYLSEKLGTSPIEAFEKAITNVCPLVEVRSRRVGGSTIPVPTEVSSNRGKALALRWLISGAKSRKAERNMSVKLGAELVDAHNGKGGAFDQCVRVHKMAESNKAFSHFKW